MIKDNVLQIKSELHAQIIVAATKYVGVDEMRELLACGIHDFGENRAQDFFDKHELLKDEQITWHFIGHLQTNKVRKIINLIHFLHSLDRDSLAEAIQKERVGVLDCFVEVNISGEPSKTGMFPEEVTSFIQNCSKYDKIRIVGLMGMARLGADLEETYQEFESLRNLQEKIKALKLAYAPMEYLSMGMSQDYKIAILAGATHLRLGTILFRKEESR